jgi:hypothetical protein
VVVESRPTTVAALVGVVPPAPDPDRPATDEEEPTTGTADDPPFAVVVVVDPVAGWAAAGRLEAPEAEPAVVVGADTPTVGW